MKSDWRAIVPTRFGPVCGYLHTKQRNGVVAAEPELSSVWPLTEGCCALEQSGAGVVPLESPSY